jgi:hypothetical protein
MMIAVVSIDLLCRRRKSDFDRPRKRNNPILIQRNYRAETQSSDQQMDQSDLNCAYRGSSNHSYLSLGQVVVA